MPSLSSYDVGKKSFEGRRYLDDIKAGNDAMDLLLKPLNEYNEKQRKNSKKQYFPKLHFLIGNHEQRIERAIENDAKIEGVIGYKDLNLKDWTVHNFLDVAVISGIAFSHYFVTGLAGRPCSTAAVQLAKKHMSCISGHQQGLQIASGYRGDGVRLTSIIAGSCLAPYHKVLTDKLVYRPLSGIKIGDKLVSFDEHLGMSAKRSRRYKTGTVTNIRTSVGELFDVTLSSGKVFRTTRDHKWLTNNCMGVRRWQKTENLRKGINGTKVSRLFDEWGTDHSFAAGWLSGMYDGEGSLYKRKTTGGNCTQLSISQSELHNPDICNRLVAVHRDFNFNLVKESKNNLSKQWRISGGQSEIARFLGSIRPQRLLNKFTPECLGTLTSKYPKEIEYIVSVESVGIGEYVEIEIDAATMIVEGYGHHNCYTHNEDYLGAQGNRHWRGVLVLNDVNEDGEFDLMPLSLSYLERKYGNING